MTFIEFFEEQFRNITLFLITVLSAGASWTFRTILTNGKRIDLLEHQAKETEKHLNRIEEQSTKILDAIMKRNLG